MSPAEKEDYTPEFLKHFARMDDLRQEAKVTYPLDEVFLLVLCAVVSGADGWTSIALFGAKKLELLRRFLPFKDGTPSHDQLGILFSRLDIEAFQRCFAEWIASLHDVLDGVVAIDGKTLRRSFGTTSGKVSIHMISAWSCEPQLVLGQCKVDDKSNEITAIPKLLDLLALKGAIVTIDAMGCQRSICQQVIDQGSDYVIGLKGNQGSLREDVKVFFDEHLERNIGGQFVKSADTIEADHGRIETRCCTVCSDTQGLINRHNWTGLKAVLMTEYTREIRGKSETVRRFYISSFVDRPEEMARHIRSHWQVENSLHWVLDVTFRQDQCRIRQGNAAANFATINHAATNLLRGNPSKISLPQKQRSAAWDNDYMEELIRQ